MLNNSEPRTEPWGTPCVIRRGGERWPLMRRDDVRLVMNDSNHLRALSLIQIYTNCLIRILWSSVSNAANMLSKISIVPCLLLRLERRLDVIRLVLIQWICAEDMYFERCWVCCYA